MDLPVEFSPALLQVVVRHRALVRWAPVPVDGVPQLGLRVVDVVGVLWPRPCVALHLVLGWSGMPSECGYGVNDHLPANSLPLTGYGGNSHDTEPAEGQHSLFQWTLMPGRNGRRSWWT